MVARVSERRIIANSVSNLAESSIGRPATADAAAPEK
jgi:hypothetical protein